MKTATAKNAIAAALCALTLAAAPMPAVAKSATATQAAATTRAASVRSAHYEGEAVTIFDGRGSVYANWHRGASGRWWATFWTYNGTKVWACPSGAACGWSFFCYDRNGNFVQLVRSDESAAYGVWGPAGTSSHWQELGTWIFF